LNSRPFKRDLVSVIIPCYNQAHFVREAIESVFSQTYPSFEILVVDDGSTVPLKDVLPEYSSVQITRQKNQGVSSARNAGFLKSKGEYALFLDADDRLLPKALEQGLEVLKETPGLGFVSGHVELISEDGASLEIPSEPCIAKEHYVNLLRYNYIWTPSAVIFHSEIFQAVGGFHYSLSAAADWDIYLRIARSYPVVCHHQLITQYRRHKTSMNTDLAFMLKDCIVALALQKPMIRGNEELENAYRTGIEGNQRYYGEPLALEVNRAVKSGEIWKALRGACTLARYFPSAVKRSLFGGESEQSV
jgi:glycosyltransferase involved in cell wall biosynthesis